MDNVIAPGELISYDDLEQLCHSLANDLVILATAAAKAQLSEMDRLVRRWFVQFGIDPRISPLKVLIIGSRTARRNNMQVAYFERLLGEGRERNMTFIEELFHDEKRAQSIVSAWYLDEHISNSFFRDPDRMHADILMNNDVQGMINELCSRVTKHIVSPCTNDD